MLEKIEVDTVYKSPSGIKFKVNHLARHAQDCSWPMVVYTNIEPTKDAAPGTIWVMAESIFMKTFSEV